MCSPPCRVFHGPPVLPNFPRIRNKTDANFLRTTGPNKHASPQVKPWVYWEAPVTAGNVAVDFDIDGTRLNFTGVGGHDRNWGPYPLAVCSLGWKIGRVFAGPYTAIFWRIGSSVDGKTYLASALIKSGEVIFTTRNLAPVKRGDYLLFSQTHVNHTGTPFDPSKARTTFTLDFTSAKKKKHWKFDVNFADPEWALGERGFGGFVSIIFSSESRTEHLKTLD